MPTIAEELKRKLAHQLRVFGAALRYEPVLGGPAQNVRLITADPTTDMEVPAGALKLAFGSQAESGLASLPIEGDQIWIGDLCYRVFDVKVDAGGMFQLALTQ